MPWCLGNDCTRPRHLVANRARPRFLVGNISPGCEPRCSRQRRLPLCDLCARLRYRPANRKWARHCGHGTVAAVPQSQPHQVTELILTPPALGRGILRPTVRGHDRSVPISSGCGPSISTKPRHCTLAQTTLAHGTSSPVTLCRGASRLTSAGHSSSWSTARCHSTSRSTDQGRGTSRLISPEGGAWVPLALDRSTSKPIARWLSIQWRGCPVLPSTKRGHSAPSLTASYSATLPCCRWCPSSTET